MSEIKLAAEKIPVYRSDVKKRVGLWGLDDVVHFIGLGQVAQMVCRMDGAIRRITLKSAKGSIASRSHRTATVTQEFPMTWGLNKQFYGQVSA